MSSYHYVVPESTTEVYYPKSKRRVKLNHRGEIIEDTREDDKKGKKEPWMDG
jgi:hypothetical protein